MPMADRISSAPAGARTVEAGGLLIGAGAVLVLVSLFLEWYQPGIDAWSVFEVWDLVLAVLAIGALVALASRLGYGPPRPASWVIGPAAATLVIVVYAFLDPPPPTAGLVDGDPGTGLWLALVAALLMATGAVLSVARISIAITAADPAHAAGPAASTDPAAADAPPRRR
jgi:peptidoglycan/LPS O-acetylase OafA/YrhL